jgi:hypothetical protein
VTKPNPANNELEISYSSSEPLKLECTITDVIGNTVLSEIWDKNNGYIKKLRTNKLQSGVYMLTVENDQVHVTKKVIIQH